MSCLSREIRVGIVGLDTSHSVEFIRRMQAPDCPADQKVGGLWATACLRFETPFQNKEGLDGRQKTLEGWGVKVTERFEDAVADCDAVVVAINDPAYHLEYFRKCAALGKPIFLDKPMADTIVNAREIAALAASKKLKVMSCSSLRYVTSLLEACRTIPAPAQASFFGPLGKAPAGSSIVWYGVHAFEMLGRTMGRGAATVTAVRDQMGVVCVVAYPDGRRGVVELAEGNYNYGGMLRGEGKAAAFVADMSRAYTLQLTAIEAFFRTGEVALTLDDTLEVMALLDAAQQSSTLGTAVSVQI